MVTGLCGAGSRSGSNSSEQSYWVFNFCTITGLASFYIFIFHLNFWVSRTSGPHWYPSHQCPNTGSGPTMSPHFGKRACQESTSLLSYFKHHENTSLLWRCGKEAFLYSFDSSYPLQRWAWVANSTPSLRLTLMHTVGAFSPLQQYRFLSLLGFFWLFNDKFGCWFQSLQHSSAFSKQPYTLYLHNDFHTPQNCPHSALHKNGSQSRIYHADPMSFPNSGFN